MLHALLPLSLALAPHLPAARAHSAPRIDGTLDDPAWLGAPADDHFVQKLPAGGEAPSGQTRVSVLYDDDSLYVGIACDQPGAPVVARLTRRDREVDSDRVSVDVDSRRDGRSAFHFEVNAAGVLVDGIRYDDTELSLDWDENWEARAARTDGGWSAELRIPLRILRFDETPSQEWGLQVRRWVSRRQEEDEWSYIPSDEAGEVSRYGTLGPLDGLRRRGGVEVRPFLLGALRRRDAADDVVASGLGAEGSAGVDLKWHVTQELTLDATVNPDFAQVEADEVVLNLTNFEQFYPEKRPFFLEGTDTFATPIAALYTRRIGRQPDDPELPAGERLVDHPRPAPIWAAAKLVGRPGAGFTTGLLSAVVGPDEVVGLDALGLRHPHVAAPLSLFEVARVKRDLGSNAGVGALATAVVRLGEGADGFHDAYVGGVDWRWRSPSGAYVAGGQALASLVSHGPPRTLPDGTRVASGDASPGGLLRVAKEGGAWLWEVVYEGYGRRFDLDDAGFLERQNEHSLWFAGERHDVRPGRWLLEESTRVEIYQRWNLDGVSLAEGYQLNTSGRLRNFWSYFVELHYRAAHFDDRELGDGRALERAGLIGLEASVATDPRRAVTADLSTATRVLANGFLFALDGRVGLQVHPQLDFEVLPQVLYTWGEPRFVGTAATGDALFGRQRATELGATLRATYTFAPRLTLQAFTQLFAADLRYSDFQTYDGGGRVIHLDDLMPTAAPAESPDERERALTANVVLRWEYRLGATLFVVYGRSPGEDALVVKLSGWWG